MIKGCVYFFLWKDEYLLVEEKLILVIDRLVNNICGVGTFLWKYKDVFF